MRQTNRASGAPLVSPPAATPAFIDLDPRVAAVARPARAVPPDTRIGLVAEILRMSPYRALAVVENERLLGMASEAEVLGALLGATDAAGRARVRQMPIRAIMTPPAAWTTPGMRASEAASLFHTSGVDALPVVDANATYLGMIARSDLVQDLVRPFRPPTVGGMATPLGVYLTTGAVSGGAGAPALVLTGLVMSLAHLLAQSVGWAGRSWLITFFGPHLAFLPHGLRGALGDFVPYALQFALFLLLLRLSPIAGFHAAEHQVVHALERAEPLLVETVRQMPRVHPRCGTNLVAGMLILLLGGMLFSSILGAWSQTGLGFSFSFLLSFLVALSFWRNLGAWLQQHFTTRPATDAQIESGIRAARELLEQHGRAPYTAPRPFVRLWRMGFLQILTGFATGHGLLALGCHYWPPLRRALGPLADALLF
jgi:CBS domain-containing protein